MSQLPLNPPRLTPDVRTYCEAAWMDWRNNYLSTEVFADHNGITPEQARTFISIAKAIFHTPHPEE